MLMHERWHVIDILLEAILKTLIKNLFIQLFLQKLRETDPEKN